MIALSRVAERQLDALLEHYAEKGREEAIVNLGQAVLTALARIEQSPLAGLAAPRPYPATARSGERWIKEGRYWFGYTLTTPPIVIAVFFETADIPTRR